MSTSSPASRIQANLQELFEGKIELGDAHIKFQLTPKITALLSMQQVQESLIVEAEKITTLPSMPKSTIGIMNSRDRVFCIFDLAQLLGLPSELTNSRQYQVVVLKTIKEPSILIGFAVAQLQGIVRIPKKKIQIYFDNSLEHLSAFSNGAMVENDNLTPILELGEIVRSLPVK